MKQMLGSLNAGGEEAVNCGFPVTYAVVTRGNTAGYVLNPPPQAHTKDKVITLMKLTKMIHVAGGL